MDERELRECEMRSREYIARIIPLLWELPMEDLPEIERYLEGALHVAEEGVSRHRNGNGFHE